MPEKEDHGQHNATSNNQRLGRLLTGRETSWPSRKEVWRATPGVTKTDEIRNEDSKSKNKSERCPPESS